MVPSIFCCIIFVFLCVFSMYFTEVMIWLNGFFLLQLCQMDAKFVDAYFNGNMVV